MKGIVVRIFYFYYCKYTFCGQVRDIYIGRILFEIGFSGKTGFLLSTSNLVDGLNDQFDRALRFRPNAGLEKKSDGKISSLFRKELEDNLTSFKSPFWFGSLFGAAASRLANSGLSPAWLLISIGFNKASP